MELPFFTNLLILLVLARIMGELFEKIKQPAMIGEIIAGIILGPSLLNLIHRTDEIKTISELGVFLLVIIAGLEINIDDVIKSIRGRNLVISIMAFFLPLFSGLAVGYFYGLESMTTVFIGLCIAITALPVSIRILMDLGKIQSETGQRIISVAIFDDVLAFSILGVLLRIQKADNSMSSIITLSAYSLLRLLLFVLVLILAYKLISRLSRKENYLENQLNHLLKVLNGKESLYALFFVFVLIFATITESLGFHFIIGAFFAAMLISENLVGKKHLDSFLSTTSSLAMGFLAPVFFAGIGLEFNFGSISNFGMLIAILAVSFLSKILGGFIGGKMAGLNRLSSLTLGIGLNARGIMELVIANIAYNAGVISHEVFSILVIMGLVTTLSTPFMLKRGFALAER